jgi:hypothetical protein
VEAKKLKALHHAQLDLLQEIGEDLPFDEASLNPAICEHKTAMATGLRMVAAAWGVNRCFSMKHKPDGTARLHAEHGEMLVLESNALHRAMPVASSVAYSSHAADHAGQTRHDLVLALMRWAKEADCVLRLVQQPCEIAAPIGCAAALGHDSLEYGLEQRARRGDCRRWIRR